MTAEECLQSGQLDKALEELQASVRANPADPSLRVFLFQLYSLIGEWERAMTQLNVAGDLDSQTLPMVQTYRVGLQCEVFRSEVYAGQRSPLLFGEPERWSALMLEAIRTDDPAKAASLREEALELAPTTAGTAKTEGGQESFEWIADGDSRLGPMLEVVVNGNFYWVPFSRVQKIEVEAPADLRDLVWCPAFLTWANGGRAVGLLPSRYPGSESNQDSAIRMGRRTEWQAVGEDADYGIGQRMWVTDAAELPLLDIREIHLETTAESSDATAEANSGDAG